MDALEIKKMSILERLQIMEALWDSLLYEESEIESPEWHRELIEERKRKIENGKAEFISIEELKSSRKYGLRKNLQKEANFACTRPARVLRLFEKV